MKQHLGLRIFILICTMLLAAPITLSAEVRADTDASSTTLAFGAVVQDAITDLGNENSYTFTANAGDLVLVRMSPTSSSLEPSVQVTDEEGTTLCSASFTYGSPSPQVASCTLPATATYTVYASDRADTRTGTYALYLQRLNEPGQAAPIDFGSTESGSITTGALYNTYTLSGQPGDRLVFQATTTSGAIRPKFRLYDPDGALLCQNSRTYSPAYLDTCALLVEGSHTLLVGDDRGTNVGVYNLHVQRLNAPAGSLPLEDARLHQGTISTPAQLGAYTFAGEVGQVLILRAAPTSVGGLDPQLRLYNPHGTLICSRYANDRIVDLAGCRLATDGIYTLLVDDYGANDVGSYDLFMVRTTDPSPASPLSYAEFRAGDTQSPAALDMYRFEGRTGEVVAAQLSSPDSTIAPYLRIYGVDGTLICHTYSYSNYGRADAYVRCVLPADQTYLTLAGSYDGSSRVSSGLYHLYLQRLNPPVDPRPIHFRFPVSAAVVMAGKLDTYTFRAAAGDVVTVRMSAARRTIDPQFRLYDADGVLLRSAYAYTTYSDGTATATGVTLPFSGTYTLLAGSYGATTVGPYMLSLLCDGAECGFPPQFNEHVALPLIGR